MKTLAAAAAAFALGFFLRGSLLAPTPAAASDAEVIQGQLRAITERLDRLQEQRASAAGPGPAPAPPAPARVEERAKPETPTADATPSPPSEAAQAANAEAARLVSAAVSARLWTRTDAHAFTFQLHQMTLAEKIATTRQLLEAINSGAVKTDFAGPPF